MIRQQRASMRSHESSMTSHSNEKLEQMKDMCRKVTAFMCTQVGVGGLIVGYSIIGAFSFMSIETQQPNSDIEKVAILRNNCAQELWIITERYNTFNPSAWKNGTDSVLKKLQDELAPLMKKGYDGRKPEDIWTFPAALMFCLSVFTMIGYGNMVPRTQWGKAATVIYATFGIPLYILYFLNIGKVLAKTFKWIYTWVKQCTTEREDYSLEDGEIRQRKKTIVVPSTACLWVITVYIAIGTIMFAEWEGWDYLDSVYFCVTSLCKIGIGDFVPGASIYDYSKSEKQSKLAINFVYMLFGMSIVAMCYNLMREDVRVKMQEMREDIRLCLDDLKSRFAKCCGDRDEEIYY